MPSVVPQGGRPVTVAAAGARPQLSLQASVGSKTRSATRRSQTFPSHPFIDRPGGPATNCSNPINDAEEAKQWT